MNNIDTKTAKFRFEPMTMVDHKDGGWRAVIVARHHAGGNEIYGLRLIDGELAGESRLMLSEVLVPTF